MASEYYVWLTDYNNNDDVTVKTATGSVTVESPSKIIKIGPAYTELLESKDEFKQQAAISGIINQYNLDTIDATKTFWSISPFATQQAMIDQIAQDKDVKRGTMQVDATVN
tara:strand:- start:464 stop:796 length:333 start_codon:yes stop_codon:yes gene_type:complete